MDLQKNIIPIPTKMHRRKINSRKPRQPMSYSLIQRNEKHMTRTDRLLSAALDLTLVLRVAETHSREATHLQGEIHLLGSELRDLVLQALISKIYLELLATLLKVVGEINARDSEGS